MSQNPRSLAQKMRAAGKNDGAILLALSQQGLSPDDAEEVVRSLGGESFELEHGERVESEWNQPSAYSDFRQGLRLVRLVVSLIGVLAALAATMGR